jgi:hypothetical protein
LSKETAGADTPVALEAVHDASVGCERAKATLYDA